MPEAETLATLGRLTRLRITGLLGEFSHDIELEREDPTILTGANGTGKSTILRLMNAVGSGDWFAASRLPFRTASLYFEKEPKLEIARQRRGRRLKVSQTGHEPWTFDFADDDVTPQVLANMPLSERQRILMRNRLAHGRDPNVPPEYWSRMQREQEVLYLDQLSLLNESIPDWLQALSDRFKVRFITDQRLVVRSGEREPRSRRELARDDLEESIPRAVSHYSTDLGRRITTELRQYAAQSQREDRQFPERIARALTNPRGLQSAEDDKETRRLIEEVARRRDALERVGLAEVVPGPRFDESSLESPAVRVVFKTFGEATLRKYAVLESLRESLELFTSFLNRRFIGKTARIRAEDGLYFELTDGSELRPAQLSSGEQQMLVLAYEVLFEADPGTLLLIDEPEISLHVLWQSTFVEDIAEMGRSRDLSFLLATHSPTLIGGRRDLTRSLDQDHE